MLCLVSKLGNPIKILAPLHRSQSVSSRDLLDERALQRKQPMHVRGNPRWQPGPCTGDLNLLLAIVKDVVGNTLVLSTSTMKAGSDSISKVSQKLDRGQKTELLCN